MHTIEISQEIKDNYSYAIKEAKKDRPRYFNWIANEIEEAINLINNFDKKYVLGGLGARLIKATPNFYNQFLAGYTGPTADEIREDELISDDDEIEVLLEYAMSIACASPNNSSTIPNQDEIEEIYQKLSKIKININFWELTADTPTDGNEFDHWLRTNIMQDSINVRGDGYHSHIFEVYNEIFEPHNGFLEQYYGFNAIDVIETVMKLDSLVYSKVGNPFGATQSHKRLQEWFKENDEAKIERVMVKTGKHFIQQFTEDNPDLYDGSHPDKVVSHDLSSVPSYSKVFWVLPKTDKEKLIFERLSISFGENELFFQPPKFKAFPLNDTQLKQKPLIKENDRYYHFSLSLGFRNIFKISEALIKEADAIYYDNTFKGNANAISRDNYIELKTKKLFEKLLPNATFYHSLDYTFVDGETSKKTELDILGLSRDTAYIIEVKAGELNVKHRRGALKGLKDRLKETINEGSYQCHRALNYIDSKESPTFEYKSEGTRKELLIDKKEIKNYFKISVTFEHFSSISANLKYLINSNVLSPDFKWTWIISLYDLMVFADILDSEDDFKEYLENRIMLYDRDDVEFSDEIDILGYYLEGNFPIENQNDNGVLHIANFKEHLDNYYNKTGVGLPGVKKPKKK